MLKWHRFINTGNKTTLTETNKTVQTMHTAAIFSRLVVSRDDRHFALRDLKNKFIENNRWWPTKILMLTIDNQQSTVDRSKDHS